MPTMNADPQIGLKVAQYCPQLSLDPPDGFSTRPFDLESPTGLVSGTVCPAVRFSAVALCTSMMAGSRSHLRLIVVPP